jgi:hypothetical protein
MAQNIGINAPTRIPSLGDDASIEEALKKYHYGIDNWDGDPVQNNLGVDGNFKDVKSNITTLQSSVSAGGSVIRKISPSSSPNIITSETNSTIPLVVGGISGQTANIQVWQNVISSTNTDVAIIFPNGAASFRRYLTVGNTNLPQSTTTALDLSINAASDKGIVVKAATSQTGNLQEWKNSSGDTVSLISNNGNIVSKATLSQTENLQEWQNSSGNAISWVDKEGRLYYNGDEVGGGPGSFFLMGA